MEFALLKPCLPRTPPTPQLSLWDNIGGKLHFTNAQKAKLSKGELKPGLKHNQKNKIQFKNPEGKVSHGQRGRAEQNWKKAGTGVRLVK